MRVEKESRDVGQVEERVVTSSQDEEGEPLCWWPLVEEWEKAKREAKIKKEDQSIPLKVKKEQPLSP